MSPVGVEVDALLTAGHEVRRTGAAPANAQHPRGTRVLAPAATGGAPRDVHAPLRAQRGTGWAGGLGVVRRRGRLAAAGGEANEDEHRQARTVEDFHGESGGSGGLKNSGGLGSRSPAANETDSPDIFTLVPLFHRSASPKRHEVNCHADRTFLACSWFRSQCLIHWRDPPVPSTNLAARGSLGRHENSGRLR